MAPTRGTPAVSLARGCNNNAANAANAANGANRHDGNRA